MTFEAFDLFCFHQCVKKNSIITNMNERDFFELNHLKAFFLFFGRSMILHLKREVKWQHQKAENVRVWNSRKKNHILGLQKHCSQSQSFMSRSLFTLTRKRRKKYQNSFPFFFCRFELYYYKWFLPFFSHLLFFLVYAFEFSINWRHEYNE